MPLVSAKCTNCGSNLAVENTKDAAVCEFCGSAFIVEKAINNYNITNNVSNNISGSVVNIYGGNSADFIICAGTLEKYSGVATDVVIPNSVTIIGDKAFEGCSGLISVTMPDSVTSIGREAFKACYGLKSVIIGNGVTIIGTEAFNACVELISINIPDSILEIGTFAFNSCHNLTSITIPSSVEKIWWGAFRNCSGLTKVIIPKNVKIAELYPYYVFEGCSNLLDIESSLDLHYFKGTPFYKQNNKITRFTNKIFNSINNPPKEK